MAASIVSVIGVEASPEPRPAPEMNVWLFRNVPSNGYGTGQKIGNLHRFPAPPRVVRRRAALNLQFQLEGSANLGETSWDPLPFTIPNLPIPAGDGLTEFVTLEFEAPPEPKMFFRVALKVGS